MNSFNLRVIAPFRLDLTVSMLRRVPSNKMDIWDDGSYHRVIVVNDKAVSISISQYGPPSFPELIVTTSEPELEQDVSNILKKMLRLDLNLSLFFEMVRSDSHLAALVEKFSGFRPPRFETIFEAIINGISCQQLSLNVGIQLLNKLCTKYGHEVNGQYAFPRPDQLIDAHIEDLRALGYSTSKAKYILSISRSVSDGLDLGQLEHMDNVSATDFLCSIYGVGRWTAQYTLLRGLGRIDMYPADDVGGQTKIKNWYGLNERPNYDQVHQIIDKWSPYQGLLYFYLFLDQQEKSGMISSMENSYADPTYRP